MPTKKAEKPLKKDLPVADQARITRILDSDPETLSSADRDFIFARRDYLTDAEAKAVGITAAAVKEWTKANEGEDEEDDEDDE